MSKRSLVFLILILGLAFFLRVWRLDELPGEMWGDVIEGYKFAQRVLSGDFYWRYEFGGDGPLFSYLVAFLSLPLDLSFFTMKLTTILVGLMLVIVVYYLGKEYVNERVGLLAAFLMAVSKWSLIFSRMAKPHILAALFAGFSFLFLLRFLREKDNQFWAILCGISFGLGMYTQSAFWGVPLAILLLLIYQRTDFFKKVFLIFLPAFILLIPFIVDLYSRSNYFFAPSSFFGEKMFAVQGLWGFFKGLLLNLSKNSAMFHFRGDGTFRSNPPGQPQLDFLSGIFFILGALALRQNRAFLWIPFFVIQISSLLDVNHPLSTPNAGRTIALIPLVYLLAGIGINWSLDKIRLFSFQKIFLATVLFTITILNFKDVFVDYALGLPNQNVPFGKIIAREIDDLPLDTKVYIIGCCWGEWGQPEPGGIKFALRKNRQIEFFAADDNPADFTCDTVRKSGVFIVVNPANEKQIERARGCFPNGQERMIQANGYSVAWSLINL